MRVRISCMRPSLAAVLLVTGFLTVSATSMLAQEPEEEPPSNPETAKPYVPPPARKSVEIGNYYLKKKKYNAALSRFQEAVGVDPYYAPAYLGLGKVYEKIGLKQKALGAYRKYLDALPSTKDAEEAKEAHRAIERLERQLKIIRPATGGQSFAPDPGARPR